MFFWNNVGRKELDGIEEEMYELVICLSRVELEAFATCHGRLRRDGGRAGELPLL